VEENVSEDPLENVQRQLLNATSEEERATFSLLINEQRNHDRTEREQNSNLPLAQNGVSNMRMLLNAALGSRRNQLIVAAILVAVLFRVYF